MSLRNRISAIPQSQFFLKSATSSPQLKSFTSAIFSRFLAWSSFKLFIFLPPGVFCYWEDFKGTVAQDFQIQKKIGGQKSRATVPLRQFLFSTETKGSKNIIGCFLKASWAEEKGLESSKTGRRRHRVAELRKSNFEVSQSQFRNFFSPQFRNRFGCPQYCGIAEVRTKIADARTKIADAHFWKLPTGIGQKLHQHLHLIWTHKWSTYKKS